MTTCVGSDKQLLQANYQTIKQIKDDIKIKKAT